MSSDNELKIVISAVDEASAQLKKVRGQLRDVTTETDETSQSTSRLSALVESINKNWYAYYGLAAAAGLALNRLTGFFGESIAQANDLQSALLGLSSIANHFGQSATAAQKAARNLASDGLMTVADAATGLKNLLAAGFGLDQAIVLMNRFKDSAAFNRQASLSFGDAIRTATEGIKNGNSILVDNAGVTKNLSIMLEEAGYSAQDLMKASQDAGVRQAIFNGIVRETNAQVGDAAKLAHTFAGQQSEAAAQTKVLEGSLGTALQAALLPLLRTLTPIIQDVAVWTQHHQTLTAVIALGSAALLGLVTTIGVVGAAINVLSPLMGGLTTAFGLARTAGALFNTQLLTIGATAGSTSATVRVLQAVVATPLPAIALAVVGVASIVAAYNAVQDLKTAYDGLSQSQALAQETNDELIRSMRNNPNLTPQRKAALTKYLNTPGFASGVENFRGGVALVGEEGPELVNLPAGSDVIPTDRAKKLLGGSGAQINLTQNIYNQIDYNLGMRELGWSLAHA